MDNFLYDYPVNAAGGDETSTTTNDESHLTGSKNSGKAGANVSVATYQWLIVVGALAALWAMHFGLKSAITG